MMKAEITAESTPACAPSKRMPFHIVQNSQSGGRHSSPCRAPSKTPHRSLEVQATVRSGLQASLHRGRLLGYTGSPRLKKGDRGISVDSPFNLNLFQTRHTEEYRCGSVRYGWVSDGRNEGGVGVERTDDSRPRGENQISSRHSSGRQHGPGTG